MKVWEVKCTSNLDGITESETWLFQDEAEARKVFQEKTEEDLKYIQEGHEEGQIHIDPPDYDRIDDGDYIVERGQYDYSSWQQGWGADTTVECSLREKEVK